MKSILPQFFIGLNLVIKSLIVLQSFAGLASPWDCQSSGENEPCSEYPPYPTYPTPAPPSTTTPWTVAYSTVTARNSSVGPNTYIAFQPFDMYGYNLVKAKKCRFDQYLFIFRYLADPAVCADHCLKETSCTGFTASIYSGACEAFTQCIEEEDDGWVVYYRQSISPTTRYWAGTSPTPNNYIDLSAVTNISSILTIIDRHYGSYGSVIQTALNAANVTRADNFPLTRLTTAQAVIIEKTLEMAWKGRITFSYQPVEGWGDDASPYPLYEEPENDYIPGTTRRYKCNQGTVDSACRLLKLNNEGILFLLPWLWEGFFNKEIPTSPAPGSVAPLYTIATLCYGDAPPTYTHELVCPDPAMLNAIGALARSVFNTYSEPLYVATIIGSPSYVNEDGLPSVTHYYGSGVDFLCGVAIYAAAERAFDDSCHYMVRRLKNPQFGGATPCDDVILPARDEFVGCGGTWWPIPTVHCDKTIIGS